MPGKQPPILLTEKENMDQLQSTQKGSWRGAEDVMQDPDKRRELFAALDSFYQYSRIAHYSTTHIRRQFLETILPAHREFLTLPPISYLSTLDAVDDAIDSNALLSQAIFSHGMSIFSPSSADIESLPWRGVASSSDMEKARNTLRQIYRDWSSEAAVEREACYGPMIRDLQAERKAQKGENLTVLVPGAGLARLAFELCKDGFVVEANEISYHQLLANSYILHGCPAAHVHTLYPWAHIFMNHKSRAQHLQSVAIPDLHPPTVLQEIRMVNPAPIGEINMCAADFVSQYGNVKHKDKYDAVATMFFIDTAPDLIQYVKTICNCLRKGGIWTNLGPLYWYLEDGWPTTKDNETEGNETKENGTNGVHTELRHENLAAGEDKMDKGIPRPVNVELTEDEVLQLVEAFGFAVVKSENGILAPYIHDSESMLQTTYHASHWVVRKK